MIVLRRLFIFLVLVTTAAAVFPFFLSSLYIDQRGITIPGQVRSKREEMRVHYSSVTRTAEVTIEFDKPDRSGAGYLPVSVTEEEYDAFHPGQAVSLHYLRKEDLPDLKLVRILREESLLPTARLANQQTFSWLKAVPLDFKRNLIVIGGVVLFLIAWRALRLPGFLWIMALCLIAALITSMFVEIPRPTVPPEVDVRQARGTIKRLANIDELFQSHKDRGIEMVQPIQVVGVQFIPDGKTDPVLAIDLIDAGSLPGATEKAEVTVDYESAHPRVAYIQGARRTFFRRNITGAIVGLAALGAVLIGGFGISVLMRRGYRRLTSR